MLDSEKNLAVIDSNSEADLKLQLGATYRFLSTQIAIASSLNPKRIRKLQLNSNIMFPIERTFTSISSKDFEDNLAKAFDYEAPQDEFSDLTGIPLLLKLI
jgi:hypothetical protein